MLSSPLTYTNDKRPLDKMNSLYLFDMLSSPLTYTNDKRPLDKMNSLYLFDIFSLLPYTNDKPLRKTGQLIG